MTKLVNPLSNEETLQAYVRALREAYDQPAINHPNFGRQQWLDIPYSNKSERQKFNVYLPGGTGPFPAIVWVHGGGWYTGDRSDRWLDSMLPFIENGFALISVGYRLADEAVFPNPVEDVVCAVEQIYQTGAKYNIDTKRIGVVGGSAGANIAAHAALRCQCLKAALLLCPPLNFAAYQKQFAQSGIIREGSSMPEEDTSYEAMYLGGSILRLPEKAKDADPANHLLGHIPPFLLIHGTADAVVPYQQSVVFRQAVVDTAGDETRAALIHIEDGDHDAPALDLDELMESKLGFFQKYLK